MKVSVAEAEISNERVVVLMHDTDAHHLQAFFVVIRNDSETVWSAIYREQPERGSIDEALRNFSEIVREDVLATL